MPDFDLFHPDRPADESEPVLSLYQTAIMDACISLFHARKQRLPGDVAHYLNMLCWVRLAGRLMAGAQR